MRKKVGELFIDDYSSGSGFASTSAPGADQWQILSETRARTDFNAARNDAMILLEIHDQATGGKAGRPKPELEALKRSALILAVTAWESFVEDTVTDELDGLLNRTSDPAAISSIFNSIAHEWLDETRSGKRNPPELIQWTADNWKGLVRQSLRSKLDSFNTPNSSNIGTLFKRYLNVDIVKKWAWQAVSPDKAQKQLDALIKLRGRVVHRGRTMHPVSPQLKDVRRTDVVKALNLVYFLVDVTEDALGVAPKVR